VRLIRSALVWLSLFAVATAQAQTVLNRGNPAEPGTLDPAQQTLIAEYEIVSDLFMGLCQISPKGLPIPGAAESWTTSADGRTTTFKLAAGLTWSDGVKLTAEDFVYTFRRVLDPATGSLQANMAFKIKNAEAVNTGKLPVSALGVSAPDERTFVVELAEPSPALFWLLTQALLWPVPKHVIAKHPKDWTKPGILVSNGPYVLKEWRPHDHITLVKNPRYYDAKKVRIDVVKYFPLDDEAAAVKRFRAREIDLNLNFPAAEFERLKKILPKGAVRTSPSYRYAYMTLNNLKPPFNDARVRRAVSLAVDRETLTSRILGLGEKPNYSLTPAGIPGYVQAELDFKDRPMERRREEARRLLSEAGYGPTKPLILELGTFSNQIQRRLAIAIADNLKRVGISASIRVEDTAVYFSRLRVHDFTAGLSGWLQVPDPEFYHHLLLSSSNDDNSSGYSNPAFDAKVAEAARAVDMPERLALFREAEAIALADSPVVPLYTSVGLSLVAPHVKGWEENPLRTHPTRWLWIEKKK
jgi:oligopeptide transport system substrate-binding protein